MLLSHPQLPKAMLIPSLSLQATPGAISVGTASALLSGNKCCPDTARACESVWKRAESGDLLRAPGASAI